MKSFRRFLNENILWPYYNTYSVKKLADLFKGSVVPVFSMVEIGDPEIAKRVSIFYDGYENSFIISEKIDFTGEYYERGKFLTFKYDEHRSHCSVCFHVHSAEQAYTVAQLVAAFGDKSELEKYDRLIEKIFDLVDRKHNHKPQNITEFGEDPELKKLITEYEEDYEEKIPTSILTKLGLPLVFVTSRKYGL
jgi:hypothetical protein